MEAMGLPEIETKLDSPGRVERPHVAEKYAQVPLLIWRQPQDSLNPNGKGEEK